METNSFEFKDLNDLEPQIFQFILDNISEIPSNLTKEEEIDYILSNYSSDEIENLLEEYDLYEMEITDSLNELDEETFDLVSRSLKLPSLDKEDMILHIIGNFTKDKIEYTIESSKAKIDYIDSLEELDEREFELILEYFNLSGRFNDRESVKDYILESYSLSHIKTSVEVVDRKLVFFKEMCGFDDDVFSFISFYYSSLDYNSFKDLENQKSKEDKAFYLISRHSTNELNQKAVDFISKRSLFTKLDSLDEVLFRILIKNMDAYSFFLSRLDIIYNILINYSEYIVYIELDKAMADFKQYDELRNLDDVKLLFLANYLDVPEEKIDKWIESSDIPDNIFKGYDVNPKNHVFSLNVKEEKEEEDEIEQKRLFKFNDYFGHNPLELSPKEEIAYYIYKNKTVDDVIEGLNSVPNDMDNVLEDFYSHKGDNLEDGFDKNDSDNLDDSDSDDNLNDSDNDLNDSNNDLDDSDSDDNLNDYNSDDDSNNELNDSNDNSNDSESNDEDKIKINIKDEDDHKSEEIKVKISNDKEENPDEIKVKISKDNEEDSKEPEENQTEPNEHIYIVDVPDEVFKEELNSLESKSFKILTKKLNVRGDNKVSIIDNIVANYKYNEVMNEIKSIQFNMDHYNKLDSLDDVTFELLARKFPRVSPHAGRLEKTIELVDNYSFKFIEDTLALIESNISDIKTSLADEDLFFEIATWFKLPLHASKEDQIDYLLLNNSFSTIKNMIALNEGKLRVHGLINDFVNKGKVECPNCGAKIRKDDKHCYNCGAKLSININID